MPPLFGPALRRASAAAWLPVLALGGCAGPYQERHLAPLFTELSLAGGGVELEGFGGSLIVRRESPGGPSRYWAIRPLVSRTQRAPAESFWSFLPPLGQAWRTPAEDVTQLLPIWRYTEQRNPEGEDTWSLLMLPGIYWAKTADGSTKRAVFPFGGVVEHFLSFDRATFALFPLWARVERNGRISHHVLWPIFCFSHGEGGPAWRFWPLVGHDRWEGRYSRWFFLWPFFHFQRNRLNLVEERQETAWLFWPLYGRRRAGPSRSWTFLWPFFGYTSNSENGFWAWDGPWPLVVLQQPGTSGQASRVRVWPFYSRFEGDGLISRWILWPLYNQRWETYLRAEKRATRLFPFWGAWDREHELEGWSRWRKLFPLYRTFAAERGDHRFVAFPALNPFWRMSFIDEHYAWLWEVYNYQRTDGNEHTRSWLGMYRREKDADEDRRSFSMLWANRRYSSGGQPVRETSLLFGLIRWRSSGRGLRLLPPAFPGPGWPLQRVPSSLPAPGPDGAGPQGTPAAGR